MDLFKFYLKSALFLFVTVMLAPFYFIIVLFFYICCQSIGPKLVQFYSKICLLIFRVKIHHVRKASLFAKKRGLLIISNHVSFLDIFVLAASFGSVFVSKAEVMYYPIIGQAAWLSGAIFFDRKSSREKLKVLKKIAKKNSARPVVIFAQGTTGCIDERLPFNRGIFRVVELNPDIILLPVTIHYEKDAEIAWSKPQSLKENAIKVSSQRKIHVKVIVHEPITIDDYRGKTASQICQMVEQIVLSPLQKDY
jgi:1-acyl-sn-glycerol-3-phosphate acyltransferase